MSLSNNLVRQFVKVTTNKQTNKKESTVYGKIVGQTNGKWYVKLDGSESETSIPISRFTSHVNADERVIVMIKDHSAIVTGNLESPSAGESFVTTTVDNKFSEIQPIAESDISALWANYKK